jgi:hypothetical protein
LKATFSLIWGHAFLRSFSVHLSVSGHFNSKWDLLSSPTHRRHLTFSVPPLLAPFSFQNSSYNHAVSLLYPIVDVQLVNKALDIQEIIKNSLNLIKVSLLLYLGSRNVRNILLHVISFRIFKSYSLKTNFNIRSPK